MPANRFLPALVHGLLWALVVAGAPVTALAQVGTAPLQSVGVIATGTTRARPLADHLADAVYAQNFGACTWDGSHDVAPCIQAALNAAAAQGGGDVIVPVGRFPLASGLTVAASLTRLVSAGGPDGVTWDDNTHQGTFPTVLVWSGSAGAAMLVVAPAADPVHGAPLIGTGISGILFDANAVAGYGAELISVRAGEFRFGFRDATVAGVLLDTVPLAESNDVQANTFSIRGTNGDTDGDGIRFNATGNGGAWNGNVSLNAFDNAWLRVRNGWCLNFTSAAPYQSADNNEFGRATCQQVGNSAGTGGGIHLVGGSQEVFRYYSGAPVVQEAGTAGNRFLMLDTSNGTAAPTINGGGAVYWVDSNGIEHNDVHAGPVFLGNSAGQSTAMQTAGVYDRLTTLQIVNSSDDHIGIWNSGFGIGWKITTNSTTGDLRFLRAAGTGGLNLGNGAAVKVPGALTVAGQVTLGSVGKPAGTAYSFTGAGDLLSGSPLGNALTVSGRGFTSSGASMTPSLSVYSETDSDTNPATRRMVLDAEGTSGAGAIDLALRNSTGGWIRFQNSGGAQTGYVSNTGTIGATSVQVTGAIVGASLQLSPTTPASSSAACTSGQIAADSGYVYVCTATNTWKRAALTSW